MSESCQMNEVESLFFETAKKSIPGLEPQYWIGKYRVDFAIPADKLAIEIDGKKYHSDHQRQYKDKPRQRAIEVQGWTVIRFEAAEIYRDARGCLRQTLKWLDLKQKGLHIERIFPT